MSPAPLPLARGVGAMLAVAAALFVGWRAIAVGIDAQKARSIATQPPTAATAASVAELRQRVVANPTDTRALVLLALELERQGKPEAATAAMRDALRLSPGDPPVLLEGAAFYLRAGQDSEALTAMRRFLDAGPGDPGQGRPADRNVYGVFVKALETGRHVSFFERIARDNPSWWPELYKRLCDGANAEAVQFLFDARAGAKLATPDERRCLVERFQRDGMWTNAYVLWLNGLPLEQRQKVGYVFNGTFEWPLSNSGFDWRTPPQDGIYVATEAGEGRGEKRVLSVTFENKRYAQPPISQYLLLAQGNFVLEGQGRTDLETWLGLQWGIYCVDPAGREPRQLAHTMRFVGAVDWREFAEEFEVPRDCPAQVLRLELANPKRDATSPGNVAARMRGRLWFGDIRVRVLDARARR